MDTTTTLHDTMIAALQAPAIPEAVTPLLSALVENSAAVGSGFFQKDGEVFAARAAHGEMPSSPQFKEIVTHGLPAETPLIQRLSTLATPLFIDDTSAAPEGAGFPELGVASLCAAPVRDNRDRFLGAFLMHTFSPHAWTTDERHLVSAAAGSVVGLAGRLIAEEEAVSAREGAIRALGLALEYRDRETKGHTDRVTNLSLAIGQEMGLDARALKALQWGAYLHDVGKIAIPDAVLLKPGRLTDEEFETIKTHAIAGWEFSSRLGFLDDATLSVVRNHHEKWDGSGYPDGIAAEEIPLAARIFAVSDVFDALTSTRPYKEAWPPKRALAEIHEGAGSHFDPEIPGVLERVLSTVQ